jgi:hypothetical protein
VKQKDIALVFIVAIFAGVISLIVTQTLFVPKKDRAVQAEVVTPIKSEFQRPDTKVFNDKAINPTQLIQIGNDSNPRPF